MNFVLEAHITNGAICTVLERRMVAYTIEQGGLGTNGTNAPAPSRETRGTHGKRNRSMNRVGTLACEPARRCFKYDYTGMINMVPVSPT